MRVAILNTVTVLFRGQTLDLDFEAKKTAIFRSFLPAMASSHTSMNYNRAVLKNR